MIKIKEKSLNTSFDGKLRDLSLAKSGDIIFIFNNKYIQSNAQAVTEIWESDSESLQTQQPVLDRGLMSYGIGMWLVDEGYCAKNNKNL